jgi:hypothetical protein
LRVKTTGTLELLPKKKKKLEGYEQSSEEVFSEVLMPRYRKFQAIERFQ